MELVLPNNYVAIEQDEMMYLDGGDWNNFKRNIEGLWISSAGLRFAMRESGLTNYAGKAIVASYPILMAKAATISAPIIWATGGAAAVVAAGAGVALWNMRLFY
ncbi:MULTISPECIES: hypothetical protein [unclassified Streptococcus]|uniref:hypothetical protein n=1 Tax=unclassified Streptococcus TaxID=2608887 RepID=UPI001072CD5D|nr:MULTISPECIES: hypothetical protein [unclassified Streptococcus]MBF0786908.1 hypothetical protein [Streptococcus sp. 19428wC2_LYSM12]MCQ9212677.1 hypothetical protein [Streptococcus sp. B01]MCQ9214018.1 hypothetical protein [Streptococcus sp. O1]TFV06274.1 hypothetical protein E4T79_03140 [Streptococcus sp. LYSM12]